MNELSLELAQRLVDRENARGRRWHVKDERHLVSPRLVVMEDDRVIKVYSTNAQIENQLAWGLPVAADAATHFTARAYPQKDGGHTEAFQSTGLAGERLA